MTAEYRGFRVDVLGLTAHELALLLGCYHSDIVRVEQPTNRLTSRKSRRNKVKDQKVEPYRPSVKAVHNSFTLGFYAVAKFDPNMVIRGMLHELLCFRRKKQLDKKKEVPMIVNIAKRVMPRSEFGVWLLGFEAQLEIHLARFSGSAIAENQTKLTLIQSEAVACYEEERD